MVAIQVPEQRKRWVAVSASLVAAALFLGSAVLQLMASLQRWVVFRNSRSGDDISAEDHLFDYSVPYDPWEPIGTAAEFYGVGLLLMALGVLVMPLTVSTWRREFRHRGAAVAVVACEFLLTLLVACSLGVDGTHALISGINATPSPLQHWGALGWVGVVGLIALAILWRQSRTVMLACTFLIGSTWLGYLLAAFVIAPIISGGSHDTAPWTETVVAASAAAAGIAMIFAARAGARRMLASTRFGPRIAVANTRR